ncbi:MAG: hypothetical protein L0229_30465 [Blastocatellia bacterium]|nr:hypothetical protein [Blastocatellia bacterium]
MAKYHCPRCQKQLKKGDYADWVKWFIGPIFGQLLKPLMCDQHGEVEIRSLVPEEQRSAGTTRMIGIVVGSLFNVGALVLILWLTFRDM